MGLKEGFLDGTLLGEVGHFRTFVMDEKVYYRITLSLKEAFQVVEMIGYTIGLINNLLERNMIPY
jgi:hypothetical protein